MRDFCDMVEPGPREALIFLARCAGARRDQAGAAVRGEKRVFIGRELLVGARYCCFFLFFATFRCCCCMCCCGAVLVLGPGALVHPLQGWHWCNTTGKRTRNRAAVWGILDRSRTCGVFWTVLDSARGF